MGVVEGGCERVFAKGVVKDSCEGRVVQGDGKGFGRRVVKEGCEGRV